MPEGLITGHFDYVPIIRHLLESEAAFVMRYSNYEIAVAFSQGTWSLAKAGGERLDFIEMSDSPETYGDDETQTSPITLALLESLIKIKSDEKPDYYKPCRELPSRILIAFLKVWGGSFDKLKNVHVVKPGRNSIINEKGEIIDNEGSKVIYKL